MGDWGWVVYLISGELYRISLDWLEREDDASVPWTASQATIGTAAYLMLYIST